MKSSLFKKTIALLLAVSIATCIAGCGSEDEGDDSGTLSNSDKIATNTNKNGTIETFNIVNPWGIMENEFTIDELNKYGGTLTTARIPDVL